MKSLAIVVLGRSHPASFCVAGQRPDGSVERWRAMSAELKTGADMLIRALKDQGVDVIFGYPGGAVLPVYDALFQQNDIQHILVGQEVTSEENSVGKRRV